MTSALLVVFVILLLSAGLGWLAIRRLRTWADGMILSFGMMRVVYENRRLLGD